VERQAVLIDAHVHFHDCFDLGAFLDGATGNFERARRALPQPSGGPDVLMLAERAGDRWFDDWWNDPGRGTGSWRFDRTAEPSSLLARLAGQTRLVVVAGRQLVTSEGLEVLALGTRAELASGRDLEATLDAVRAAGALPVLPWGVGKWLGARGRLVDEAIERRDGRLLFLGDNGGRCRAFPAPARLGRAKRDGLLVLPGSDPLPLPGQERRVGAFGFGLRAALDPRQPARALLDALAGSPEIAPYGSGVGLVAFARAQLGLRLSARRRPTGR
jgi:hypothetical protein